MKTSKQSSKTAGSPKSVILFEFVLIEAFSMMSFISAIEPLRVANRILGYEAYDWCIVSEDGEDVYASNRLSVSADGRIGEGPIPDYTLLCAGLKLDTKYPARLNAFLQKRLTQTHQIGAISMGSFFLARAGLLDNRRCTIHWEGEPTLREEFPDINVTRAIFEADGPILTCSGGMSAFDMVLSIIARDHSEIVLREIANQLQLDHIRTEAVLQTAGSEYLSPSAPKIVQTAIALMGRSMGTPVNPTTLAKEVGASRRTLERLFVSHTGMSPAKFSKLQRLERARDLLLHGSLPIIDIAIATGFRSGAYFSYCFSEHFNVSPSSYRTQARIEGLPKNL
jgi:transcriptional regulator GlxA family with amidase domain